MEVSARAQPPPAPPAPPAQNPEHDANPAEVAAFYEHFRCSVRAELPQLQVLPTPKVIHVAGVRIRIYWDPSDLKLPVKQRALVEAVERMVQIGMQLPGSLDVVFVKDDNPNNPRSAGETCMTGHVPTLMFTADCLKMGDPAFGVSEQYSASIYAEYRERRPGMPEECDKFSRRMGESAQCLAVILHELCHVLHMGQAGGEYIWSSWPENEADPDGGWQAQAPKVGAYAGKARVEFVAEVCSGRVLGGQYDAAVMQAYGRLGGPRPNRPYAPP